MSENRSYLCTFPFSQENHYLGSKNIILFTPKLACECVFTSVACGNSHLCSILICHFRVYFQENWKIIFKIWPLKTAKRDQALTDWTMLVSSSQSSCKKKFCCLLWSDNKLFKLSEEYEVSSSIYRSVNKGAFHVVIDFLLIYGAAGFCRGKTPFQQL